MFTKISVGLAALAAVTVGVYLRFIRPWQLRWGATDEEVARAMPGDEVVKHPTFHATRAVTIRARPEEIWPWLVQIGTTRAGWYSYDWLDNFGIQSAQRILPQFQQIHVGDLIPISADGKQGIVVQDFQANRFLLFWSDQKGEATWYWGLYPQEDGRTRLINRARMHYRWTPPSTLLFTLLVEFADIVMIRKCLLGIKQRAERASRQAPEPSEAVIPEQVRQEEPVAEA